MSDLKEDPGTNQDATLTSPQIDLEKGVVTLKKGEAAKSFKLNDANDLTSLIKMGQRGWYFDEEASLELGNLRKVVKNWDTELTAARSDDEAMGRLVQKLELAVGRPLTKKEEKQMEKGETPQVLIDEGENSRFLQTIDALKQEINSLKQSQVDFKTTAEKQALEKETAKIMAEADQLVKKYDGKDGQPKFEKEAVFAFAAEKNIPDLELAFKLQNFDSLTAYHQKKAVADLKAQQDNRQSGFVETGDQPAGLPDGGKRKFSSYQSLGEDIKKTAKNEGISFFSNE